jgi:DNA polymerase-3 subunit gamma/tau
VPAPADDEIPPPEEPAYPDYPDDAGPAPAAAPASKESAPAAGRNTDEAALRLLQTGLGARRIG